MAKKCEICLTLPIGKWFNAKTCEENDCKNAYRQLQYAKQKSKKQVPIKKVSDKRKLDDIIYKSERIKFLMKSENKICFIEGCNKPSTTIEHRAGRGINYLNQDTWAGCCLEHNLELENNTELSKKYQLSKIHGGEKL